MAKKFLLLLNFVLFFNQLFAQEKRLALIVGNNAYTSEQFHPLENCVADAEAIASKLKGLGFTIIGPKNNTSKEELKNAISEFVQKADDYDVALFYYSGHGIQYKGSNYLVPIDVPSVPSVNYLVDPQNGLFYVQGFLADMEDSDCKLGMIVLDACRNNEIPRSNKGANWEKGLAKMREVPNIIVAYATEPGKTATDTGSPYARAFLEVLDEPNVDILTFFNNVGRKVKYYTDTLQIPQCLHSTIDYDFVFNKTYNPSEILTSSNMDDSILLHESYLIQQLRTLNTAVIPKAYDGIRPFSNGMACVHRNGNFGFINDEGEEIIPLKYNFANDFHNELAFALENDSLVCIDKEGKLVSSYKGAKCPIYVDEEKYSDDLARVVIYGKVGYVDKNREFVIPCRYDYANDFSEGVAAVCINGKFGYINELGEELVPCKYDWCGDFSEGLGIVVDGVNWKYVDKQGKEPFCCKYTNIGEFSEGLAAVQYGGKYGYINKQGEEVIPCFYTFAGSFSEGIASVILDHKMIAINECGTHLFQYEYIGKFSDGLACVKDKENWRFVNTKGQLVFDKEYEQVTSFNNGLAKVMLNGKYGCINTKGEEIIPIIYTDIQETGGYYIVQLGGRYGQLGNGERWGCYNKSGKLIIPCEYNWIDLGHIHDRGLIKVYKKGKYGCFNIYGRKIIPCKYKDVFIGSDGFIRVNNRIGLMGAYNVDGVRIIPIKYADLHEFSEGLAAVLFSGGYGFINLTGDKVTSRKYDIVKSFSEGIAPVIYRGQWFFINKNDNNGLD